MSFQQFANKPSATINQRDLHPGPITMVARDDLPSLPTLSSSSSSAISTPSVGVPPSHNNPYLIRQHNPNGTVFIAVGAIVGTILLMFALYHLILAVRASRMAKKSVASEKHTLEKYRNNNSMAYGDAKVPFMHHRNISAGAGFGTSLIADLSTIYGMDDGATLKHDLTKMFFLPTAEAMQHKKLRSLTYLGSTTTVNQGTRVPNMYVNGDVGSEFSLQQTRLPRKTIPSMYLDDLLGGKEKDEE